MKIWKEDILGVLGTIEEVRKENGRDNVFINNENSLQFLIKIISTNPEGFPNIKFVSCFTNRWDEEFGFHDEAFEDRETRIEKLKDFLEDYLLIFNVEEKQTPKHDRVYNAKNVRLVRKNDSYNNEMRFHPIPMFNKEISGVENFEDFLKKIKNREFVGKLPNIMHEQDETPEFILWERDMGTPDKVLGYFLDHEYAHGGFKFTEIENLSTTHFENEWLDDVITNNDNIAFLSLNIFHKIEENLESNKTNFKIEKEFVTEEDNKQIDYKEKELEFLEEWNKKVKESGLSYSFKDLINFHTSMKSSTLVILSGTSGVGKTKLVDTYQRALGLDNEQFKFISVSPSWTEDSDLIGYADTLNMIYRPSDSGLIETLIAAEKETNSDKVYIICFDEMNLAKVEHYFSQFLSKLELEPTKRYIQLYVSELENRLYNTAKYPPLIQIKDNVHFVGTVNVDESTHHFSNKVLDRSNVLELDVLNFKYLDKSNIKKNSNIRPYKYYEDYKEFVNKEEGVELSTEVKELLWEIQNILILANKNIGFGPRVVKQIDAYMKNLPETEYLSEAEALDLQIQQRILTKLRGSEDEIEEITGKYNVSSKDISNGNLARIFDKYSTLSDFHHCRETIKSKAKELNIHGYAF